MIMIAQEVSTAKPPTNVENGKITKMGVGPNQLLKRDELRNKLFQSLENDFKSPAQ